MLVATFGSKSDIGIADRPIDNMENFAISPDGNWWSGEFSISGNTSTDNVHLRGQGSSSLEVIWQEGVTPLPYPGVTGSISAHGLTLETSINNSGMVAGAISNSSSNSTGEPNSFIYQYDGSAISIVAAEHADIPAYPGTQYGIWGSGSDGLHGVNALENGQVAFLSEGVTGEGVPSNYGVALSNNGSTAIGPQVGVTAYPNGILDQWDQSDLVVTPDGATFLFQGDTDGSVTMDDVIVYGAVGTEGTAVLQENATPIGDGVFDTAWLGTLASNGDWYVLGGLTNGDHVAIKNGDLLAKAGDIAPNGYAYDDNAAGAIDGNSNGNYIWVWDTENPDPGADELLVYNNTTALLTQGETISLDFGDDLMDVVVEEFGFVAARLSDSGWVYAMVSFSDTDDNFLGPAFIRFMVDQGSTVLPGDYNLDGIVNLADYTIWRNNLGAPGETLGAGRDPNVTGAVNAQDYDWWKANFGATTANNPTPLAMRVPEPTALSLLLAGGCVLFGRLLLSNHP